MYIYIYIYIMILTTVSEALQVFTLTTNILYADAEVGLRKMLL